MTSSFQREALPPARTFYERELGKLSRPSRGWALCRCPFHSSKSGKSFSVNLDSGGFHCFGCAAKGGDIVAFVMLRDRLTFKAAAISLGAWKDMTTAERFQRDADRARRHRELQQAAEVKERDRHHRIELRDEVLTASRLWKQACNRLTELRKGAAPTSDGEKEACWAVMSLALKDLHDSDREYCAAAGIEYAE